MIILKSEEPITSSDLYLTDIGNIYLLLMEEKLHSIIVDQGEQLGYMLYRLLAWI